MAYLLQYQANFGLANSIPACPSDASIPLLGSISCLPLLIHFLRVFELSQMVPL